MGPLRTCVGCRATGSRSALLRVVVEHDSAGDADLLELVVDVGRRMPGRGAWLHPDPGCLEKAERKRAFGRALRIAGQPGTSAVHRHLEEHREQDVVG